MRTSRRSSRETAMTEQHRLRLDRIPPRRSLGNPLRATIASLKQYRHDRRFWIVQALVLFATAVHLSEDGLEALHSRQSPDLFVVFMYALLMVPIIYASLNFGRAGAIPTAIWTAMLALPSMIFFHHGSDRVAEIIQHLTIIALAVVIATRVDREVAARREAEREGRARRLSEVKYRALFAGSGDAIVVFTSSGLIEEANDAAAELFERPGGIAPGTPLAALVGDPQARYLAECAAGTQIGSEDLPLITRSGGERWLEPVCSRVQVAGAPAAVQVVFRDVTERRSAQQGLEAYARQIVTAQEDERKRIARDLHDGSLQSVVLLCRRIDRFEAHTGDLFRRLQATIAGPGSDGELARTPERQTAIAAALSETAGDLTGEIDGVHRAAETIAEELRGFSWRLRPSILDDLGLVPAVEWLVQDLQERTGIRGEFAVSGAERRLPAELEPGLFRIAQEALHNVERHAQASQVTVQLAFAPEEIDLIVADDGRGFPVQEGLTTTSLTGKLGLLGMRERARLLGGAVRITSRPGQGTQLEVRVPLVDRGSEGGV